MPRYIDAEKLKQHYAYWELSKYDYMQEEKKLFDDIVDQQPTADVVEVVRCLDCKFYTFKPQQTSRVTSVRRCNRSAIVCTKPDDYCSYGERVKE